MKKPSRDGPESLDFMLNAERAQPLILLEYLNSWGNEFLFIFLIITSAFLLLFVNLVQNQIPETVPTIVGIHVPSYWATHVPIFVLIIAAVALAIYYNQRRHYMEGMMFHFYARLSEMEAQESKKPTKKQTSKNKKAKKSKK